MKKKRILIWISIVIILFSMGCSANETLPETASPADESKETNNGQEANSGQTEELRVGSFRGNRAPEFTLFDVDGTQHSSKDLIGRRYIINFWQLSCPPCLAEKKEFQKYIDEFGGEDVLILSVNINDPKQLIEEYLAENEYTFTVLMDTDDMSVTKAYSIRATPTNVFVDEEGIVTDRIEGAMNVAFIRTRLGLED
jgi:peroxiredoxin